MSRKKGKKKGLLILLIVQFVVILGLAGGIGYVLLQRGKTDNGTQGTREETVGEPIDKADLLAQEEIAKLSLEDGAPEAVKGFLALYQSCDPEAAKYLRGVSSLEFPDIQAEIAKSMTFSLGPTRLVQEEDGTEYALVEVTIETVSFEAAYEDARKEFPEDADSGEILEAVRAKLEEYAKTERDSFVIDVMVLDYANSKEILMDSNLTDAITGGLMTYMQERLEGGEDDE